MSDLSAVRAELARQQEIERAAMPAPWLSDFDDCNGWGIFLEGGNGEEPAFEATSLAFSPYICDATELVTARNSHAILLDIAEAAAEMSADLRYLVPVNNEPLNKLDAALARLTEGR